MTPRQFKPYIEADKLRQERKDTSMWMMGAYVLDAVRVAVDKAIGGKKSKAQYMDKPLLQQTKEQQKMENMTDEEKKTATEKLFANLQIMQANFEMSKSKGAE